MNSPRKIAVLAGAFFIIAAVAALAGLALYGPVLSDPHYIVMASGGGFRVLLGAFCEVILAIAVIGTAVTLFPVVKRQNEGIALGYVAGRLVEAVVIVTGIISLLSVVTLRQDFAGAAGANAASLVALGQSLVAVHDWTFLFGPGFAIGVNTLMLAYLMYRSGLVPRLIAVLGLIGGPLIFASSAAVLFGLYEQGLRMGVDRGDPGVRLGDESCRLAHCQGVQAVGDRVPRCTAAARDRRRPGPRGNRRVAGSWPAGISRSGGSRRRRWWP
jgi:Domain of unknown function (DUF4386)